MLRSSRFAHLVSLAALLCLATLPVSTHTEAELKPAIPEATITWHSAGEVEISFEYFRQHIYIPVSLDGKPGFEFMLDSGANRNVIDLHAARSATELYRAFIR